MARVTVVFLCLQAFLVHQAMSACVQLGSNVFMPNNLQIANNQGCLPNNQGCLPNNLVIDSCNQVVTEIVPSLNQCGDVSVTGDLPIGGTIRVTGCFPVYGVVAVDGAVPSAGTGYVNHSCGCN